ncbi:MAG: hypothetical protein NT157_05645 [Candidatus Micrarchaeota archaeon]|nr:hypothetical protein [Candidatus Micrarchaeota archaeon]
MAMVDALQSLASNLQLLLYVSIVLLIIGAFVYFKWKRKGVSILIFCLSLLLLLVPMTACFFFRIFTAFGPPLPSCEESFCREFCKAALNTDALISSETQAFLLLLSGTALFTGTELFGFSNEKNRKKLLVIGAILLFAGFVLLLYSAYLLNNGSGVVCDSLMPCHYCDC